MAPIQCDPSRPPRLIDPVGVMLDGQLLREAALGLQEPLDPRERDRSRVMLAMTIKLLARRAQPAPATRGTIDDLLRLQSQAKQRALVLITSRFDRRGHCQRLGIGRVALLVLTLLLERAHGFLERRPTALRVRRCSGSSSPRASP